MIKKKRLRIYINDRKSIVQKIIEKHNKLIAIGIIFLGIIFIIIGVNRHEVDTVFRKAINICLECIGIG